ncbi:hypothetical protein, partial [Segatella buccae]|uniref:hypothetical protein n=1 Tax=Segatella buccae TaxID=28126 RepID=UPI00195542F1
KLIRAEREGEKGRFAKPFGPKKRSLGGWRGRWWIGNQKRETPKCFPCLCKDTKLCGFLQMHVERY